MKSQKTLESRIENTLERLQKNHQSLDKLTDFSKNIMSYIELSPMKAGKYIIKLTQIIIAYSQQNRLTKNEYRKLFSKIIFGLDYK